MDILKFAKEGNISKNPNYNPKTKKGALESPLLVDYKPENNIIDQGRGVLGRTLGRNIYNLNQYNIDEYADYKTYVNPYDTEEELNRERAENQSAIEQTANMLVQLGTSEVALGIAKGFSDLIDFGINSVADTARLLGAPEEIVGEKDNDYTNPISSQLEEWQNAVREKFEIYRTNPNEAFDFGDFGWYTNGLVSIGSTLSLLLPGASVAKLGKLTGVTKLGRQIGKVVGKVAGKSNVYGKIAEVGTEQLITAAASRVAENYIESRDTWKETYEATLNYLNNIDDKEKEKLYNRNPKFKGKTNEEIARYAAGEGADETFKNDMGLMLLDAWQLKGLRHMWKGARNIATTRALRQANQQAIANMSGKTLEKAKGFNKFTNLIDKDLAIGIGRQLSEGFEEGYQYIQQKSGIDYGINLVNESHQSKSFIDYINDPMMWDQAFWGWIGGMAFEGIANVAGKGYTKYISKNKDILTKQRKAEIDGRITLFNNYINSINLINNNKNPNAPILDKEGKPVLDADGSQIYEELNDSEKDIAKSVATKRLITDLTVNAIDKGNYDLLKEFVSSEDVADFMAKGNSKEFADGTKFMNNLITEMDKVSELYESELSKVYNNDISDNSIISRIAKENTYLKLAAQNEKEIEDNHTININKYINEHSDIADKINNDIEAIEFEGYFKEIEYLNNKKKEIEESLKNGKTNRADAKYAIDNINKQIKGFYKLANVKDGIEFNSIYNEKRNPNAQIDLSFVDKRLEEAVVGRSMSRRRRQLIENDIRNTNDEIKKRAKFIENEFNYITNKKVTDNINKLQTIFTNNNVDKVMEFLDTFDEEATGITGEFADTLRNIKKELNLFDETTENITKYINRLGEVIKKQKNVKPVATVNGAPVNSVPEIATNVEEEKDVDEEESEEDDKDDETETNPPTLPMGDENETDEKESEEVGIVKEEEESDTTAEEDAIMGSAEEYYAGFNNYSVNVSQYCTEAFIRNREENFINLPDNEQYNQIYTKLIEDGVPADYLNSELPKIINSSRIMGDKLEQLRKNNAPFSSLNMDELAVYLIGETNDENINTIIEELIKKYTESNNVITHKGVYYFNIINLMRYIINNTDIDKNNIYDIYNKVATYIMINKDKVFNISNEQLNISSNDLQNLINQKDLDTSEIDNNANVTLSFNGKNNYGAAAALNTLKPGDELIIIPQDKGVQFLANYNNGIPTQIAFNVVYPRTSDGNGFIFTTSDGFISYEVKYDDTNGYSSTLDEFFNDLLPENINSLSIKERFYIEEVISMLYKAHVNKLKENGNDVQHILSNPIYQKAKVILKNKNSINVKPISVLKFLSNIYAYKKSDNIQNNYDSYIKWIAKQYNNFAITERLMNIARTRNNNNYKITVRTISKGRILFDPSNNPNFIDKAVANYDPTTTHIGIIKSPGIITDANVNTETSKEGFDRNNMLLIVSNGNNEPFYSKILPQKLSFGENSLGLAIKKELMDLMIAKQKGEITYENLKSKLSDIFGVKKLVSEVAFVEYNDKLLITIKGSKVPLITFYKYKNNGEELSQGVTINLSLQKGKGISYNGIGGNFKEELDKAVSKVLSDATYSLSYDFAENVNGNSYVSFKGNKMTINIGGFNKTYINYLDFIVKNNIGLVKLNKTTYYGVETNFDPFSKGYYTAPKLTFEISDKTPVGGKGALDLRLAAINDFKTGDNKRDKSTKNLIAAIAPSYSNIFNYDIISELIPSKVNIVLNKDNKNNAAYNSKTDKIELYDNYFNLAIKKESTAIRILMHEQLHRQLAKHKIFESIEFINELRDIRDEFIKFLNDYQNYKEFIDYAKSKGYDVDKYIAEIKKVVDPNNFPNKDELYLLEEFIVESLTSDLLYNALNNIRTKETKVNKENLSLFQKIINLIKKIFNLDDVKDDTLLARQFALFNEAVTEIKQEEVGEIKEEEIKEEIKEEVEENDIDLIDNTNDNDLNFNENDLDKEDFDDLDALENLDTIDDLDEDINYKTVIREVKNKSSKDNDIDFSFSSIDINIDGYIPISNMNSITANLTPLERAEFERSLARGDIQFYCS